MYTCRIYCMLRIECKAIQDANCQSLYPQSLIIGPFAPLNLYPHAECNHVTNAFRNNAMGIPLHAANRSIKNHNTLLSSIPSETSPSPLNPFPPPAHLSSSPHCIPIPLYASFGGGGGRGGALFFLPPSTHNTNLLLKQTRQRTPVPQIYPFSPTLALDRSIHNPVISLGPGHGTAEPDLLVRRLFVQHVGAVWGVEEG